MRSLNCPKLACVCSTPWTQIPPLLGIIHNGFCAPKRTSPRILDAICIIFQSTHNFWQTLGLIFRVSRHHDKPSYHCPSLLLSDKLQNTTVSSPPLNDVLPWHSTRHGPFPSSPAGCPGLPHRFVEIRYSAMGHGTLTGRPDFQWCSPCRGSFPLLP